MQDLIEIWQQLLDLHYPGTSVVSKIDIEIPGILISTTLHNSQEQSLTRLLGHAAIEQNIAPVKLYFSYVGV